jgi:hypothetical protein
VERRLDERQQNGGGHTIRFWPARDHFGNILANTYFVAMDYSVDLVSQNFDFQDNVYVIGNVRPAAEHRPGAGRARGGRAKHGAGPPTGGPAPVFCPIRRRLSVRREARMGRHGTPRDAIV